MGNWLKDTLQGQTKLLGKKSVPLPLCAPQIPNGLESFMWFPWKLGHAETPTDK